jgi:hypothetical protein
VADRSRIEDLRRRVQKDPTSIAFAQLAEECRRAGDLDEAVSVCRAGLALHPTYLSARVTLGRALLELNQLSEAQTELDYVLRSAPENLAALRALAETLHRQGDLSSSLAQYRVALSLAKNDPDLQETVASLEHQLEAAATASAPTEPQTAAAPPGDIFAFLRSDAPALAEPAIVDTPIAQSSVVEYPSAIEPSVDEEPAFDTQAVETPAVAESAAFEAPEVIEPLAFEAPEAIESPALEAYSVFESEVDAVPFVESSAIEALTVVESPAIEALTVVEPPALEALTVVDTPIEELAVVEAPTLGTLPDPVVEAPIFEHHAIDAHIAHAPDIETIETLDPAMASDLDRLWAEPISPLGAHSYEATKASEPQIQWPTSAEPADQGTSLPDDWQLPSSDLMSAAPVGPEPEPVVPAAYRLARERDARTVAVLEQWLQAVHVSRTQRHA